MIDKLSVHAWEMLSDLNAALLRQIQTDKQSGDYGAVGCPHCRLYHTRAAEAVYPFAFEFQHTGNKVYLRAAIDVGNWLIKQQQDSGAWPETPEEWTGTTTDQALMMALAYPILRPHLTKRESDKWLRAIEKAGDYLERVMSPQFASINYCATTTTTLLFVDRLISKESYRVKARELAHRVIAKMDPDYFLTGEGGRVFGVKYGVDLGYNMEMSLWGLTLYALLANDKEVYECVEKSLEKHLPFVYPDGSLDASWGIRSNKWTCFGSGTSDGSILLFSLFMDKNDQYRRAAIKNIQYLRTCMRDGIVGFGPLYFDIFESPPCIYPTFAKAKNIAMAIAFMRADEGISAPLPSEQKGIRYFPTLNVVTLRTAEWCSTISAYTYKDPAGEKSKYMHRPTGGSICNLWLKDHGYFQASSQTIYKRWEPMSFPEMPDTKPLTPRIEFTNPSGYFTNLYEFDAHLTYSDVSGIYTVNCFGELKNSKQQEGGIAYRISYEFTDSALCKEIELFYHDANDRVRIVEPIIYYPGMSFIQTDERTVSIRARNKQIEIHVVSGKVELELGKDASEYRFPYPALQAYPVGLNIRNDTSDIRQTVRLIIKIL
ncbi:MAG: hypothetical protein LBR97_08880 [Dysgonamonadaceae bacterium]|jgi:hypothetical protein|nr:hypothetical protein [Dysgonamonadaceae bacterium]